MPRWLPGKDSSLVYALCEAVLRTVQGQHTRLLQPCTQMKLHIYLYYLFVRVELYTRGRGGGGPRQPRMSRKHSVFCAPDKTQFILRCPSGRVWASRAERIPGKQSKSFEHPQRSSQRRGSLLSPHGGNCRNQPDRRVLSAAGAANPHLHPKRVPAMILHHSSSLERSTSEGVG